MSGDVSLRALSKYIESALISRLAERNWLAHTEGQQQTSLHGIRTKSRSDLGRLPLIRQADQYQWSNGADRDMGEKNIRYDYG